MDWITFLKERVQKLLEQNAVLHQKLELVRTEPAYGLISYY
jgi:hypothetical protein